MDNFTISPKIMGVFQVSAWKKRKDKTCWTIIFFSLLIFYMLFFFSRQCVTVFPFFSRSANSLLNFYIKMFKDRPNSRYGLKIRITYMYIFLFGLPSINIMGIIALFCPAFFIEFLGFSILPM